jgi:carboxylesterase type B
VTFEGELKMKFFNVFILSLILCQFSDAFTSKSLKVRIDVGKIIGRFMRSTSGRPIRAFLGIPYAAPPVGKLRFKGPQPVEPWYHSTLYAHEEKPMCSQVNSFAMSKSDMKFEGQEDCLYINVYSPEVRVCFK